MCINKAILGDNIEIMATIPDKEYDLSVCDPPYGINLGKMAFLQESKKTILQKNGTRLPDRKRIYAKKEWDNSPPTEAWFNELKRISKHQIIFGVDYMPFKTGPGRLVWNKGVPEGLSFKKTETAFCSLIDGTETINLLWAGMQQAKSLAEPMTAQGNKKLNEKRIHPCHKPILLYDYIFRRFTFPGQKVIDTHLGGGAIRISAHKADLCFLGIEIDPDYFKAQEEKWSQYNNQGILF